MSLHLASSQPSLVVRLPVNIPPQPSLIIVLPVALHCRKKRTRVSSSLTIPWRAEIPLRRVLRPPPAFRRFSMLPMELQNMIWEHAAQAPRVVRLVGREEYLPVGPRVSRLTRLVQMATGAPGILHACRASREIGLQFYELSFYNCLLRRPIYFNFDHDTLSFDSALTLKLFAKSGTIREYRREVRKQVQNLQLEFDLNEAWFRRHGDGMRELEQGLLDRFSNLKKIKIFKEHLDDTLNPVETFIRRYLIRIYGAQRGRFQQSFPVEVLFYNPTPPTVYPWSNPNNPPRLSTHGKNDSPYFRELKHQVEQRRRRLGL